MAEDGFFRKITRRFKRIKPNVAEERPTPHRRTGTIVRQAVQALDPTKPTQETYYCDGRAYVHVRFHVPEIKARRRKPIERTTDYYTKDGRLLQ